MRYIGSKKKLRNFIVDTIKKYCGDDISDKVFCDLFAGTGVVGETFAPMVKKIISNDFEQYSYLTINVLLNGYDKDVVKKIVDRFNTLEGIKDYPIFQEYAIGGNAGRMYYSTENGMKISAARKHLEDIKYLIDEKDYNAALLSIVESSDKVASTMSTYGAFSKKLKDNSIKPIVFEMPNALFDGKCHSAFNEDANKLINNIEGDILYLDPPYNGRQYGSNYHLLNALVTLKMPDRDSVTGVPNEYNKSDYCSKRNAKNALSELISNTKFEWIFMSYNNEGILSFDEIKEIFSSYGDYWVESTDYQRYKADNSRKQGAVRTCEYIHILHKGVFSNENVNVEDPAKAMKPILVGEENTVENKVSEWGQFGGFKITNFLLKNKTKEPYVKPEVKVEEKYLVSVDKASGESKTSVQYFKLVSPGEFIQVEPPSPEAYDDFVKLITESATKKFRAKFVDDGDIKKTRESLADNREIIVSPMNYMGGKKKLIKTFIEDYFPKHVDIFLDLFCGGATVGVNANAKEVWFNDVISPLIQMYRFLSINPLDTTIRYIDEKIEEWGLTQEKDGEFNYYAFREAYNTTPVELRHPLDLFVLMAYSFNNQIRFAVNKGWKFNIPFGANRSSFNGAMRKNLEGFVKAIQRKNCKFYSEDFSQFEIDGLIGRDSMVYADPPYLVSQATYNNEWNETKENELLSFLDNCDKNGIRFALSNVLENKGKTNEILKKWISENGYNVYHLEKSYANSYYHRKNKETVTDEVLITNYTINDNA